MPFFCQLHFPSKILLFCLFFVSTISPTTSLAVQKNIAFLPLKVNAAKDVSYLQEGIRDILTNRLATLADLRVINKEIVDQAVASSPDYSALSHSLKADYLVSGSISIFQENISLDITVYSGPEGIPHYFNASATQQGEIIKSIDQLASTINKEVITPSKTVAPVPSPSKTSPPLATSPVQTAITENKATYTSRDIARSLANIAAPQEVSGVSGASKSPPIKVEAQALDVGDLNGDGIDEIVFASDYGIFIYQRFSNSFKELSSIAFKRSLRVLTLTLADLDKDGCKEIYISAADEDKPLSYGLTLKEGNLDFIFKQAPWYIKTINLPGEGWTLLGQQAGKKRLLAPAVYRLDRRGTELQAGEKLVLPKDANLFNFLIADLDGDQRSEISLIDAKGYINVFIPDGQLLWKSKKKYGDGEKTFGSSKFVGDSDYTLQFDWERMPIPARLVGADINGDGITDIVVNRNLSRPSEFFEDMESEPVGSIHGLTWTGSALRELWHIDDFAGYIADYQMQPLVIPAKERPAWFKSGGELTVCLVTTSPVLPRLLPKKTTFLVYKLDFSASHQ